MKVIRKAKLKDSVYIYNLINYYAKDGLLLPRSLNSIYENIRDFWVCEVDGSVVGCAALHIVWEDLAEIKSLAVREDYKGIGLGSALVEACLKEAQELGIKKVFVLTYAREFFSRLNFQEVEKSKLPHKVWGECINCVKFPTCDEVAMWIDLQEVGVKRNVEV